ncbi:MAG: thiol-disulfide isomerase [Acidobacteria bacterium]|nr:thiol-disulfide isomerase [Acidobacteriota bacterium]
MSLKTLGVLAAVWSVGLAVALQGAGPQAAAAASAPTFSKDVAPIFYKHCTSCHRPGEIAPMSLLTYKDARPWVKSIAAQVSKGTMPPWHADPAHGDFLNERRLTELEKQTIVKWVSAGAPEGNAGELPPAPAYTPGWFMGEPDAVFAMQEDYPVPAEGTIAYQYFEVPTDLTEDKWIQAMEVRAGNPAVVHHVIVYARPPAPPAPAQPGAAPPAPPATAAPRPAPTFVFAEGMEIPAGQTGGPKLPPEKQPPLGPNDRPAPRRLGSSIGGFAPGQFVREYQPGTALRLPAGSTLVFQMHYTANGKEATTDRTRVGVQFASQKPGHEVRVSSLVNGSLHIPAGASEHRVDAEMTLGRDVTIWSLLPHTHMRGIRWHYEATYPDGRTETILSVPNYDFNWQTDYVFKTPLKLPKGTKVHATAWYNNSASNKSNPDPTKDVWWGDQTWEEMMFTGLTYSLDAVPTTTAGGQQK